MPNYGTMTLVLPNGEEVSLKRRKNPDGSIGGWISEEADIHPTAIIHIQAIVGPGVVLSKRSYVGSDSVLMA